MWCQSPAQFLQTCFENFLIHWWKSSKQYLLIVIRVSLAVKCRGKLSIYRKPNWHWSIYCILLLRFILRCYHLVLLSGLRLELKSLLNRLELSLKFELWLRLLPHWLIPNRLLKDWLLMRNRLWLWIEAEFRNARRANEVAVLFLRKRVEIRLLKWLLNRLICILDKLESGLLQNADVWDRHLKLIHLAWSKRLLIWLYASESII